MYVLKKVNVLLALLACGAGFYHFFIGNLDFSSNSILTCLALMFLLFGIEKMIENDKDRKPGFAYLAVALVMLIGLVTPYIEILF
ncbi:hypothetical protein NQ095_13350 [Rossellomorea sp. SC111]|uniref:hypothetical protein n=1 Tax=Rossellomorea sp. SC111 TaxID=2968985 RepID=UPI00215A19A5|nr:hypothetical protein [Rossellomorea sp. SC111]MCR8849402.1 hypothetical protein [Rossellomorea sp. SC111]